MGVDNRPPSGNLPDVESYERHRPGKQAFPILGAKGKVAYLDWVGVQPEPKLDGYALQIANLGAPVEADALVSQIYTPLIHVHPVARGALIEWVGTSVSRAPDRSSSVAGVVRQSVDRPTTGRSRRLPTCAGPRR
ncbi:MAG: hypothetical protein ABJE95_19010 [Byssovorax sp.]